MEQIAICEKKPTTKSNSSLSYTKTEARKKGCAGMLQTHPTYSTGARLKFNRIEVSIVSKSNVGCKYCDEKNVKTSEDVYKVATAEEAMECIRSAAKSDSRLRVVRITGSGDPLGNAVTFETLRLIHEEFPYLTVSVATDGLLLPQKLSLLEEAGVSAVSINVNAVDPEVGSQIYSYVRLNGRTLRGKEAFEVLSINQLEGIRNAADAGMMVEVKAAYIPGVNSKHLVEVAKIVRSLGAYMVNIEPLTGSFAGLDALTMRELEQIRCDCENVCASEVQLYIPSVTVSSM
jgi:nitrogen fixation protein NifB